ncbi:MAG: phosphoribosylglycinamide formyltransferase [Lachnospiraceae bacterium]|nr:phosphoribosylglycinamide formyltransferase [Lachnospiraceae bacterium]
MQKIAVLVSGGGTNLQAIIDAVKAGTIENTIIDVVISNKPGAYALERAKEAGVDGKVINPKDFGSKDEFADAMINELNSRGIDLIVMAGYLVIIPEKFTKAFKNRIINIHPSLIPSHCGVGYYGLKVHESVLSAGNKVTGATVHFVDELADHGPIILQKAVEVKEGDTPEILQKRVMEEAEWKILPKAIDLIGKGKVIVDGSVAHVKD